MEKEVRPDAPDAQPRGIGVTVSPLVFPNLTEVIDFAYELNGHVSWQEADAMGYETYQVYPQNILEAGAETLGIPVEVMEADVYAIDPEKLYVLLHIYLPGTYMDFVFRYRPRNGYEPIWKNVDTFARGWNPDFYYLRGRKGHYLAVPNWQGGTGTGWQSEYLRVWRLEPDSLTPVIDELVYEWHYMWRWRETRSRLTWDPIREIFTIRKTASSGVEDSTDVKRTTARIEFILGDDVRRRETTFPTQELVGHRAIHNLRSLVINLCPASWWP